MTEFSAKWAMKIYAQLWTKFNTKTFSREQAEETVKDNKLSQAFSKLKRAGWLTIELDPQDGRRSLYTLKNPTEIVERIAKENA